jgi:hypothetical protein
VSRTRTTDPRNTSAPLPPDWSAFDFPDKTAILAEARRAAVELMWALHRQRATWARLAKVKAELGERNIEYVDNERSYKLAVGDVQWWRGEVNSRANALTALLAAAEVL